MHKEIEISILHFHWEFPGGKVDQMVRLLKFAFQREIKEELLIDIKIYKKVSSQIYKDDKINVKVHYLHANILMVKLFYPSMRI